MPPLIRKALTILDGCQSGATEAALLMHGIEHAELRTLVQCDHAIRRDVRHRLGGKTTTFTWYYITPQGRAALAAHLARTATRIS